MRPPSVEGQAAAAGRVRFPLKIKLSLLITSLLVITIVFVSAFLLRRQELTLRAEMTKRGLTIAQNLVASAKNAVIADDEPTLNLLVKDVMNDRDVAYVVITDNHGKTLAHSDVRLVGRPLERPAGLAPLGDTPLVQPYAGPGTSAVIDFAVPLRFSRVPVGAVYVGFSQKSIDEALGRARNNALVISAVMVLIGITGAVALSWFLAQPIHRLMDATRAIAEGDFTVSLAIRSRDELGALTEAFNRMARSLREKEMIKRAFGRYVAREVADEVLRDLEHVTLAGARRNVSVLFCDIRGFTPVAERVVPEEVVALLNSFYTLMVETTFKHDGMLHKFLGDGVMAIFGAPIGRPNHAALAVQTALAMQAEVRMLSAERAAAGKSAIAVGIGVNTGEVVAGTVGTEERMEYTVIGDNVNLAERLQSIARPGQILVSEETYRSLDDAFKVRSLGLIRVKGKQEATAVYEILGPRGAERGRS